MTIILHSDYVLVVTCLSLQRGGPGSGDEDMANVFNERGLLCA